MKVSQRSLDLMYGAIDSAVMDARLKAVKGPQLKKSEVDDLLYELEREIWRRMKENLKLPPYA
jgi:hypothetical protein